MVQTTSNIQVHANLEYATRFAHLAMSPKTSYAICDSGADSCVVGRLAKVESITMRTASLVGYDLSTTKSSNLPIVTALLKTKSAEDCYMLLRVNEAVYNQNSPITLLSEYQIREYGLVLDSVARKHKSLDGKSGTQTMYVSDVVRCPLVDRGGLMGVQLYLVEDGDEELYDIFNITSDHPWIPRSFQDSLQALTVESTDNPVHHLICPTIVTNPKTQYYDPTDNDLPTYGMPIKLVLDETATLNEELEHKHVMTLKAWHRVIHNELKPEDLQPYLGFRPIEIIKATLEKTT